MNDLQLLLESVQQNIVSLNWQCNFEAERYEEIAKPWRIKTSKNVDAEITHERSEAEQEEEYSEELQKVNDILKKARLVRQKTDPVVKSNTKTFNSGQFCKDCGKGICKRHKSARPISHASLKLGKEKLPDSSYSKVKQNTKSVRNNAILTTGRKNENSSQQKNGSPFGNCDKSSSSSEYDYIKLEEILSSKPPPSKYRKLQTMHTRLKANKVFQLTFADVPVESEIKFISKLIGQSSFQSEHLRLKNGNCDGTNGVYTKQSCEESVKSCTRKCQYLINALHYKVPNLVDVCHRRESVALYREKILYTQFDRFLLESEEFFNRIINSLIASYDLTVAKRHFPSLSFIKNKDLVHFPCKYFTFETVLEPVYLTEALHELLRLRLNIYFKEKIHEYLQLFLYEKNCQSKGKMKNQRHDKDFATCLALFFGLLAKKNRCSINPAIVWES